MLHEILQALALVLIIEGILPFLSPNGWRNTMQQIAQMPDQALRIAGLISMLVGLGLLYGFD